MRAAALGLVILLAGALAPVAAQTRATVVPSVSMNGVVDDNVSASARGDEGRMLLVRPSLEADIESPKLTLISVWSFDMQRSNHSALNMLDAGQHAMFDTKYRSSTFTTWGLMGRYDRTDTPGEIDFDSLVLSPRRKAQRWEVSPSLLRRFGELTVLTGTYDFTTENLVDDSRMTLHTGRTNLARQLSPRTSLTAGYLGRLFVDEATETPVDHYSHALLLGWNRELGQFTTVTFQAGPRWTTYRGIVPEVSLSLGRDGHHVKTGFDYSHGETIILGVPGPVQIDTGAARLTVAASRKVEVGLRAAASSILTLDEKAATIYRGTLVGSWSIGGPFTLAASYSADYQRGDVQRNLFRDEKVLRHVVRVGVTVAPSFSRSFLPPEEAARAKGVPR